MWPGPWEDSVGSKGLGLTGMLDQGLNSMGRIDPSWSNIIGPLRFKLTHAHWSIDPLVSVFNPNRVLGPGWIDDVIAVWCDAIVWCYLKKKNLRDEKARQKGGACITLERVAITSGAWRRVQFLTRAWPCVGASETIPWRRSARVTLHLIPKRNSGAWGRWQSPGESGFLLFFFPICYKLNLDIPVYLYFGFDLWKLSFS